MTCRNKLIEERILSSSFFDVVDSLLCYIIITIYRLFFCQVVKLFVVLVELQKTFIHLKRKKQPASIFSSSLSTKEVLGNYNLKKTVNHRKSASRKQDRKDVFKDTSRPG